MNQCKLSVVKRKMVRENINILRISEPKWTGMGEFKSDAHYIHYCGQESLSSPHNQEKSLKCSIWVQ